MISTLRKLWHAQPFVPFTIRLADGRALPVPHPNFFFMSAKGGHMFVADENDEVDLVNPLVIVSVSLAESSTVIQDSDATD